MVRWWNGLNWSDVTTPVGPGVAVQSEPTFVPAQPAGYPQPPSSPPRRGRLGWGLGLGALGLVLVVVVALLVGRGGEDTVAEGPSPRSTAATAGPAFPPGTVRIIDEAAGISYPYLGDGWFQWDDTRYGMLETSEIVGQYFVTQESVPAGGQFIAQCTSGPIVPEFGYAGPDTLQVTLHQVVDSARSLYYPAPNEQRILRDESLTVDGAPAYLVEFDLSWDVEGYDATGERVAMLLVDAGRPAPALLYLSIPNTHAELYGVVDRVLDAVEVV